MTDHKPWYFTDSQWQNELASRARWQAVAEGRAPEPPAPQIPAGVPVEIWDRMTPAEQAKLYADQANTRAVVAAQHGTKNALWIIFVVIPLVILVFALLFTVH
jgi:hypothetical protein